MKLIEELLNYDHHQNQGGCVNKDDFSKGYFCAVSHLLSAHGASKVVDELIKSHGYINISKLDSYDVSQLKQNGYVKNGIIIINGEPL